jgi:hypothetical protein
MTIAAVIMLTALINVLIQGVFNHHTSDFINICYSLSNAASLALLVISIVLCTEIISRASSYMYLRSQNFTKELKEAVDETKKMMARVRGNGIAGPLFRDGLETPAYHGVSDKSSKSDKWDEHEKEIYNFLSERDEIHDRLAAVLQHKGSNAEGAESDFASYWQNNWKRKADAAVLSFYLGTVFMIFANVIFMWEFWTYLYDSRDGGVLAVVILILSAVIGLLIFLRMRFIDVMLWKYFHPTAVVENEEELEHEAAVSDVPDREENIALPSVAEINRRRDSLLRRSMVQNHLLATDNTPEPTTDETQYPTTDFQDAREEPYESYYEPPNRYFDVRNPLPVVGSRPMAAARNTLTAMHPRSVDFAADDELPALELAEQNAFDRRRYRPPTVEAIRIRESEASSNPPSRFGYWNAQAVKKRHYN